MLHISSTTPMQGWLDCFKSLYIQEDLYEGGHWKDEKLCLQLSEPLSLQKYHPDFPMEKPVLEQYVNYIVWGKGPQDMVLDEHAIYHARLFDYNGVDQIQYIIDTLKEKPTRRRAIAITPNPNTDNQKGIYPCLIYIWCIVRDGKLDLDIHFRGNDVYKKILMDILVGVGFMQRICEGLELDPGTYTHFVNTAHFYEVDQMAIGELYNKFNVADAHDRNLLIS